MHLMLKPSRHIEFAKKAKMAKAKAAMLAKREHAAMLAKKPFDWSD